MKYGFTLAEVLITLGIIGIVAAMTLPTVIGNSKRAETTARLKKFNSIIPQALLMSENDNGPIDDWVEPGVNNIDNEKFFDQYLGPYLKYQDKKFTPVSDTATRNELSIYLADGSKFSFTKGNCIDVIYDTNGDQKPNMSAIDRFTFLICGKNSSEWINGRNFGPYSSTTNKTRELKLNACKRERRYCSGLLEYDNWEFKKDYPYHF